MKHRWTLRRILLTFGVATFLLAPPNVSGQNERERFTGFAINTNSRSTTVTVDFGIERWTTDTERDRLLEIIQGNKNPTTKLLQALQKMPKVGYIRSPSTASWNLRYARQSELEEGGRRIVLATDRPIGFWETGNQPRSNDYPFTIVEIHLDKNDVGAGKILAGTKISVDAKKNLVLENFGQQPVRFNDIRRLK